MVTDRTVPVRIDSNLAALHRKRYNKFLKSKFAFSIIIINNTNFLLTT